LAKGYPNNFSSNGSTMAHGNCARRLGWFCDQVVY
jgi:hypothetical protein